MIDYAKAAGDRGEKVVANIINKYANNPRKKQVLISNYMFRCNENRTCQIDHLLITENGIFVIEVKNYSGVIYGKPNDDKWYQTINGKVYEFYNPIKQNFGHIYKLRDIIGKKPIFHNIVVFTKADKSSIRNNMVMDLDEFEQAVFHESYPMLDGIYIDFYAEELLNYKHRIYDDPYKGIYDDVEDDYLEDDDLEDDLEDDELEDDELEDDELEDEELEDDELEDDELEDEELEDDELEDDELEDDELEDDELEDDELEDDELENDELKYVKLENDKIENDKSKKYNIEVNNLYADSLEDNVDKVKLTVDDVRDKTEKPNLTSKQLQLRKDLKVVAITIICIVIILLCITPFIISKIHTANKKPTESAQIQPPQIIECSELGGLNYDFIRATVKANDNYSSVTVEFILYDEDDNMVDITWVTLKNLKKDETYVFEDKVGYLTIIETHRYEASIKYYN